MKNKKAKISPLWLQTVRLTRAHFFLVGVFALYIILIDAWKLATPDSILNRWMVAGLLMIITSLCWYAARQKSSSDAYYKSITWVIIIVDIFFASYSIFLQRGMASRSVLLFMIPIIISSLIGRAALFTATGLSIGAYFLAVTRYFFLHPSEGYKVEMYSDLYFYSAIFLVSAGLLWIVISRNRNSKID